MVRGTSNVNEKVKEVSCFMTTDNKIFNEKEDAIEHQRILDAENRLDLLLDIGLDLLLDIGVKSNPQLLYSKDFLKQFIMENREELKSILDDLVQVE